MTNGANSQNEVASSSDATASGGGSSSPAPTSPAPAAEVKVIHVDAEKEAVPVILPASVYNSRTGDVYELLVGTIKAIYDFPVPVGFRREGTRKASFIYLVGMCVESIDEKTAPCSKSKEYLTHGTAY